MNYKYTTLSVMFDNVSTYGIGVTVSYDDCIIVTDSYIDVSKNKYLIDNLVKLCNDLQLDPIHLDDVIDDFLND